VGLAPAPRLAVFVTAFIPVGDRVSLDRPGRRAGQRVVPQPRDGVDPRHPRQWSCHGPPLLHPGVRFGTGLVLGFSFDTTGPLVRDRDILVEPDREAVAADNGRSTADTPTTTDKACGRRAVDG